MVERSVVGEIIVRILFAMESLAWALMLMYGVSFMLIISAAGFVA